MVKKPGRGRPKKDKSIGPNPVDVHVGGRVRLRRLYMDMSQNSLARAIGLTFQQIQKYERGLNRISASRLFDLARILEVPVSFFFDDMPEGLAESAPRDAAETGRTTGISAGLGDPLAERETIDLVRAYYAIEDRTVRRRVYEITKALAADAVREDQVTPAFEPEAEDNDGAENGANQGC
jgi:transcriptional regulator with XRE-family HTH domain